MFVALLLPWFHIATASNCPLNQNTKLKPPSGGWRGSCTTDRFAKVADWEKEYGFKLHIMRVFKGHGYETLTADELNFVKGGGILFYTIPMSPPQKFSDYFGAEGNNRVQKFAKVLKALSPAKFMITIRYEPSFWTEKSDPDKYLGTPADYRSMWKSFQDGFTKLGVTNAVWAMDYSARACNAAYHPELACLWPGDGKVDWLFWNLFDDLGENKGKSFNELFTTAYNSFDKFSGKAQKFDGQTCKANYNGVQHWGLGAWGPETTETDAVRSTDLEAAAQIFKGGKYPKMQAQVYFDTLGATITSGTKKAYKDLLGLYFFTQNDKCASDAMQLAAFNATLETDAEDGDTEGKGMAVMIVAGLVLPGFFLVSAAVAFHRRRAGAASDFRFRLLPASDEA